LGDKIEKHQPPQTDEENDGQGDPPPSQPKPRAQGNGNTCEHNTPGLTPPRFELPETSRWIAVGMAVGVAIAVAIDGGHNKSAHGQI
jgi:hypothetical protein